MSLFERLTDGLRLYEVMLLMMGVIMFLALVVMLIVYASQRRTLRPLLIFFIVPVLMLVWPSVSKIKIDGEGAGIETKIDRVAANPTEENKKELQDAVDKLEDRNVKNPGVLLKIAKAHYILGDTSAAKETIKKLPADLVAKDTSATKIQSSIELNSRLRTKLSEVNSNPADSTKVKELNNLRIEASTKAIQNEQMTKSIKAATEKVEMYQRTNPTIKVAPTRLRTRPR